MRLTGRSVQSYGIDHFVVFLVVWVLFPKFWGRVRGDLCGTAKNDKSVTCSCVPNCFLLLLLFF